jgi:hypothetical protein
VKVPHVPPPKRLIYRVSELRERMPGPHDKDPARRKPNITPRCPQEINPDLQPRPCHIQQASHAAQDMF